MPVIILISDRQYFFEHLFQIDSFVTMFIEIRGLSLHDPIPTCRALRGRTMRNVLFLDRDRYVKRRDSKCR